VELKLPYRFSDADFAEKAE